VFAQDPAIVEHMVAESVRIKAEVVSADERESGLRRILNFGHTFGHALEAETKYTRFLHGEGVSWGMRAAAHLAGAIGMVPARDVQTVTDVLSAYGPIPSLGGIDVAALQARMLKDKKTVQSKLHLVLPVRIGEVVVRDDVAASDIQRAIERAVSECR
jgi:3-dehydroquinate synthase